MEQLIDCFSTNLSDAELSARLNVSARSVALGHGSPASDEGLFASHLSSVFVATSQIRSVIREVLGVGEARARATLGDGVGRFARGLYEKAPWPESRSPAVCLTGLAGTGKSALIRGLVRLLGSGEAIRCGSLRGIEHVPIQTLSLEDGLGFASILAPLLDVKWMPVSEFGRATNGALLCTARRVSWRHGTALSVLDETQFANLGSEASAQVTKILLNLMTLGPSLIYIGNYSLVHRLMRRNQEDRHRLCSNSIILEPELVDSSDWIEYLGALQRVAPDVLGDLLVTHQRELHVYTYGIRRFVIELISKSYREARNKNRYAIRFSDLHEVYCSSLYAGSREDVEILQRQDIEGRCVRKDLWCPFGSSIRRSRKMVGRSAASVRAFDEALEQRLVQDSMMPAQLAKVESLEAGEKFRRKKKHGAGRIPSNRRTAEALVASTFAFEEDSLKG